MSTANRGINVGPPRFKIAVHSLVWLAKSGGLLSSAMIASQVQSHATFMRRVLQVLSVAGIVESRGGREGGYQLKKCPNEITLGEVYCAVRTSPSDSECGAEAGSECGTIGGLLDVELEKILEETERKTIEHLRQYTIADVVERIDLLLP
ncbi:Rrf2 family transcriptional regulator [Paenibacillus sp. HB172176]|uniref:RrF2 family transcriptional regulator n=1 Tax=Paenibacillus sp. HB172176 TaxID=2493690 RepID=UPI001439DFC3|nr:Rrf2 family transcriptional regulator [Paenibacillus sp. HB172176]